MSLFKTAVPTVSRFCAGTLLLVGFATQSNGQVVQPPPPQAKDNPSPESTQIANVLLNSPDVKRVAVYRCGTGDAGCPIDATVTRHTPKQDSAGKGSAAVNVSPIAAPPVSFAAAIASHFDDPLKNGDGTDTDLATAVGQFVVQTYENAAILDAGTTCAAVHLVKGYGGKSPAQDRWLLARRASGGIEITDQARLMGESRLVVVFIYVDVTVANEQLKPLDALRTTFGDLTYRASISSKVATNLQNLLGLLKVGTALGQSAPAVPALVAFTGWGILTGVQVPSDVTVFGMRPSPATQIGQSIKYDNEGKYWWDASVAVPVTKLSLLTYSDDTGSLVPKQINAQSVYGVIDLYPIPVDLKAGKLRWVLPRIIVGLGLTSRPGQNILAGVAWGVPQIQFFVARTWTNHLAAASGMQVKTASDVSQQYAKNWTFGLNVPVGAALKQLAPKPSAAAK